MPQELRVVRCFQCNTFQSDIVKKAKKWTCKMCGAQQSLIKEFARGSGKECRLIVQQLSARAIDCDRVEQTVAQKVLAGEIQLPDFREPLQEESARLACHENRLKAENSGNNKWDRFRVADDDSGEEDFDNSANLKRDYVNGKEPEKSPLQNFLPRESSNKVQEKRTYTNQWKRNEFPSQSQKLVPLANFHQMDKKEKSRFKWESSRPQSNTPAVQHPQLVDFHSKSTDSENYIKYSKRKFDSNSTVESTKKFMNCGKKNNSQQLPDSTGSEEAFREKCTPQMKDNSEHSIKYSKRKFDADFVVQSSRKFMNFGKKTSSQRLPDDNGSEETLREKSSQINDAKCDKNPTAASKWNKFVAVAESDPSDDDDALLGSLVC